MVTFRRNPYSYGSGAEQTNTPAISLEAFKSDGSRVTLNQGHEPLQASIKTSLLESIPETVSISTTTRAIHTFLVIDRMSAISLTFDLPMKDYSFRIRGNLNKLPTANDNIFSLVTSGKVDLTQASTNVVFTRSGNVTSLFIAGGSLSTTGELMVTIQTIPEGNVYLVVRMIPSLMRK